MENYEQFFEKDVNALLKRYNLPLCIFNCNGENLRFQNNYLVISQTRVCLKNNVSSLPYVPLVSLRKNMLVHVFTASLPFLLTPLFVGKGKFDSSSF